MAVSIKHTFQSAKTDGADTSLVQPSNWNAEHNITLAASTILGRISSGTGTVEELSAADVLALLGVGYGVYLPTLTNTTNVASSAAYSCQYIKVGNIVTVTGQVDITPTAAAYTELGISLPIASNLAGINECAGTASPAANATGYEPGAINSDTVNDRAKLSTMMPATTTRGWFFTFTYRVN